VHWPWFKSDAFVRPPCLSSAGKIASIFMRCPFEFCDGLAPFMRDCTGRCSSLLCMRCRLALSELGTSAHLRTSMSRRTWPSLPTAPCRSAITCGSSYPAPRSLSSCGRGLAACCSPTCSPVSIQSKRRPFVPNGEIGW
jgi:hypothetical protein